MSEKSFNLQKNTLNEDAMWRFVKLVDWYFSNAWKTSWILFFRWLTNWRTDEHASAERGFLSGVSVLKTRKSDPRKIWILQAMQLQHGHTAENRSCQFFWHILQSSKCFCFEVKKKIQSACSENYPKRSCIPTHVHAQNVKKMSKLFLQ